jgi:DNA polymerase-1
MALLLIDVSSLIYRAYHSLSPEKFKRPSDGLSNNAVYGVASIIFKIINDIKTDYGSVYPIACFDSPTCNVERQKVQSEYKSNRPKCPEGLSHQFKWIRELFVAIKITCIEVQGYEADDIIATMCHTNYSKFKHVVIASPDKDLNQLLLEENIIIYNPKSKVYMNKSQAEEKYKIKTHHFTLYQALVGDAVDNISGVYGIGPKTAVTLINNCDGDIQNFKQNKKLKKKIDLVSENIALIESNMKMVTLNCELELQYILPARYTLEKMFSFGSFLTKMEINSGALWRYGKCP